MFIITITLSWDIVLMFHSPFHFQADVLTRCCGIFWGQTTWSSTISQAEWYWRTIWGWQRSCRGWGRFWRGQMAKLTAGKCISSESLTSKVKRCRYGFSKERGWKKDRSCDVRAVQKLKEGICVCLIPRNCSQQTIIILEIYRYYTWAHRKYSNRTVAWARYVFW